MTPLRIKPATFRLVVQCLNQLCHCTPLCCLRLVFNLFVVNIDLSQSTLYGLNNKSQLISTPVTCRQRYKFLYFSQYPWTFNSIVEGLGSTRF